MTPDAATAVIAAAIEDAARRGHNPHRAAQAAVRELRRAGWTIIPTGTPTARHTGTQAGRPEDYATISHT